jgi:hypothetical protein
MSEPMTNERLAEIEARCKNATDELHGILPPQVDYAELVCAEGFSHRIHYVWTDP